MACERDPLRSDAARWPYRIAQREPEEVPMAIVGGLDIHRRQITYDYLDTTTGQTRRGQLSPATRLELRAWLDQFDPQQASFALEATTGWRFVTEELQRVGIDAHLAEPADTRALRGPKRRAMTDRTDALWHGAAESAQEGRHPRLESTLELRRSVLVLA